MAALAAAALGGAALLGAAAPAHAAGCSSSASGVTVVVTFPGGSTSVRCAGGDPDTGATALQGAGFSITQIQTQPGFLCRIDGAPASDPCVRTPPVSAYWSYWTAQPGGSWSYVSTGAFSRNPAPGTIEGWSFGAGAPPAIAPPRIEAPAPPPPPPPPPPSSPPPPPPPQPPPAASPAPSTTTSAPRGTASSAAPAPRGTASSAAPAPGTSSAAPEPRSTTSSGPTGTAAQSTAPSATETESGTVAATDSVTETASDATTATDTTLVSRTLDDTGTSGSAGGPSVGTIAGLGVAGLLLGAAGWTGWRRRAL